jgi:hypothetical protein
MKKALELALDVLNESWHLTPKPDYVRAAITAIEAALAQQDGQSNFCAQCEAFARELKAVKEALAAQPAQEPWCMGMNRCMTKCEDCPDEPAQEPITVLTSAGYIADEDDDIQVYQHPWVGLTEAQFLEATRLAENGNYLVAFVRIQEWLKEKNYG